MKDHKDQVITDLRTRIEYLEMSIADWKSLYFDQKELTKEYKKLSEELAGA